jgi:hypothetical protein
MEVTIEHPTIAPKKQAPPQVLQLERRERANTFVLPEDAREWVDPCTLILWVQEEVETLTSACETNSASRWAPGALGMLGLVTFAYASNVLASHEISSLCNSDPAFRFLSENQVPFPSELTVFRRHHRLELQTLLLRVLDRVINTRMLEPNSGTSARLALATRDRLDIARHLDNID